MVLRFVSTNLMAGLTKTLYIAAEKMFELAAPAAQEA